MNSLRLKRFLAALVIGGGLVAIGGLAGAAATDEAQTVNPTIETITAEALNARLSGSAAKPLVVDVREPEEFEVVHIDGALLAPLGKVEADLEKIDRNREIVLVCRSGRRSAKAYHLLAARGFTAMKNLEGGMIAWEKLGYPVVKKK